MFRTTALAEVSFGSRNYLKIPVKYTDRFNVFFLICLSLVHAIMSVCIKSSVIWSPDVQLFIMLYVLFEIYSRK